MQHTGDKSTIDRLRRCHITRLEVFVDVLATDTLSNKPFPSKTATLR